MLDFETSKSNSEVSKSNSNISMRYYFFLKNHEPFLTKFYTINSSPLIVNKKPFMLTIILSITDNVHYTAFKTLIHLVLLSADGT